MSLLQRNTFIWSHDHGDILYVLSSGPKITMFSLVQLDRTTGEYQLSRKIKISTSHMGEWFEIPEDKVLPALCVLASLYYAHSTDNYRRYVDDEALWYRREQGRIVQALLGKVPEPFWEENIEILSNYLQINRDRNSDYVYQVSKATGLSQNIIVAMMAHVRVRNQICTKANIQGLYANDQDEPVLEWRPA